MVAYTKPQQRKKEESEGLRGERDQIRSDQIRSDQIRSAMQNEEQSEFKRLFSVFIE